MVQSTHTSCQNGTAQTEARDGGGSGILAVRKVANVAVKSSQVCVCVFYVIVCFWRVFSMPEINWL